MGMYIYIYICIYMGLYNHQNQWVYVCTYVYMWLVVSNMAVFSISYTGCHPKPIDELHHFSRWLDNHSNSHR